MNSSTFHALLSALPTDGTVQGTIEGWTVSAVSGGANNTLHRARRDDLDVVVKFTIRDERDRAGREHAALRLLEQRGVDLAPKPLHLDRDHYPLPVVVQAWLDGTMVQTPPQTDEEWGAWLDHLTAMHRVGPTTEDPELLTCWSNANGSEGYRRELARLQAVSRSATLPFEATGLIDRLAGLRLDGWAPEAPILCRADYNVRNFIRTPMGLRSVDWEYSGWGDPAEDLAEMMAHVTYMGVPTSRWRSVLDRYLQEMPTVDAERIRLCLALKIVGWVVRIAQSLGDDTARGEWRKDSREKYDYYLRWAESDDLVRL